VSNTTRTALTARVSEQQQKQDQSAQGFPVPNERRPAGEAWERRNNRPPYYSFALNFGTSAKNSGGAKF
jgi:hypothetical protein